MAKHGWAYARAPASQRYQSLTVESIGGQKWLAAVSNAAVDRVKAGIFSALQPANERLGQALQNPENFLKQPNFLFLFESQTAGGLLARMPAPIRLCSAE